MLLETATAIKEGEEVPERGEVATVVRNGARGIAVGAVAAVLWSAAAVATAAGGAQLPDGRAYELASPPQKNGGEVIQQTAKTHVASDGNAVTFSSLGVFGDVQGTSFDSEYVSRRTGVAGTSGWTTRGINPPGGSETLPASFVGNNSTYVDAFTPDLVTAVYRSWRPLTSAPNVAEVSNLYRITGLGSARTTPELMSNGVNAIPPWPVSFKLLITPAFVGASTDLAHVVFESRLNLTADAPAQGPSCAALGLGCPRSLYENAGGVVRLVGRIPTAPDTACDEVEGPPCVTAPTSQAGVTPVPKHYSDEMVSEDGRRVLFQVPAGANSGAIYMREDGVRTVQIAQDGQLWAASADGSRAFFITTEQLVVQDGDGNPDVYMYRTDAPAGARLTLVSASSVNDGYATTILGVSADGRYVYFVSDDQLVPGEPAIDVAGLYVWQEGDLSYIGQLGNVDDAKLNGPRTGWDFVASMRTGRVSPDGRHLLFMTRSDAGFRGRGGFAGYDHAGQRELYLYSSATGRLACASCNPSRRPATTDALTSSREGAATSASTSKLSHALADDGSRVFFTSAEALVPEDTNALPDAYQYDAGTGSISLISSGTDSSPSYFIDASDDGKNVFFVTRARLVGWDVDDSYDLYDAREGGGLPEPVARAADCAGEGCLGQTPAAPAAGVVASPDAIGAGDAAGKLRRHKRCARRATVRRGRGRGVRRCVRRPHRRKGQRRATRASIRSERGGR